MIGSYLFFFYSSLYRQNISNTYDELYVKKRKPAFAGFLLLVVKFQS